jgi:hypothetical protein
MLNHNIKRGLSAVYTKMTSTADAYDSSNTGTLAYLVSTPAMILMLIDSSTDMLDQLLPPDYITVGKKLNIIHEIPSIIGDTITLKLHVEEVKLYSIILNATFYDTKGIVCIAKYERAIIEKSKLLEFAHRRLPELI